jgi:hypothetical protein
MLITKLIKEFSLRTVLPVDVNDVVKFFQDKGVQDEIEFIGVDLDPEILLGKAKRFTRRDSPYGDPILCTNVYYYRGAGKDLQRMICCKELLHIANPKRSQVKTPEEIHKQAEKIGLPPGMQDAFKDGPAVNVDRLAEYQAIAVLFPWAARNILLPFLKQGKLSIDDIARMADIPKRYISVAMADLWEVSYKSILELQLSD